jgi:hypothetical protein
MSPKEKLLEYFKKHGRRKGNKKLTWSELTEMFNPGASPTWAKTIEFQSRKRQPAKKKTASDHIEEAKDKGRLKHEKGKNSDLTTQIIQLQNDLEALKQIKQYAPSRFNIPAPSVGAKQEATAIVQWSDWHVDELVDPETVNGMNEHNPQVVRRRATKLFQNTLKLVNSQRSAVKIKRLVIHHGGDSIGAYIHPELQQTNTMSPIQGIFFAKELSINGIDYLLKEGEFDEIIVVCSRGNHPRLTPKMQFANDFSMNLEAFLYHSLADHYKNEKRISFKIDKSEVSYLTIYGNVLRFFHGHQVKSNGGIGGIGIPLYKAIHRWNQNIKAYYNFMCDKHTYSCPTPDCQLNGSMKGYDAYAASHGFSWQPPIQSFTLLDSKYGITIKAPIHCE